MKEKSSLELFAIALYEGGYLQGNGDEINDLLEQHKAMHKEEIELAYNQGYRDGETNNAEQAQQYAEFCVQCDRQGLPLLEFNGWINLERNEQQ